jgi:hypothetical protein
MPPSEVPHTQGCEFPGRAILTPSEEQVVADALTNRNIARELALQQTYH